MSIALRTRYDTVAMALHWVITALMLFMFIFGEDLVDVDKYGSAFAPSVHASVGIAILVLTILRLVWRLANPPPNLPASMAPLEKMAAQTTHLIFYVLLIGLPLTGWLATPEFLREEGIVTGITVFGVFPLPSAPNLHLSMNDIHELSSNVTIGLLALHVLAALKHQFINRDDVLRRMLP